MERKADIEATVMFLDRKGQIRVEVLRIHDGATVEGILATVETLWAPMEIGGITLGKASE